MQTLNLAGCNITDASVLESKALGNTTHIYLDKSGGQVEVTCVSRTINNHGSGWDDIVNVGQVCQWVKSIKNHSIQIFRSYQKSTLNQ